MLSRFFHNWEQQLASITKDRVVRPFEWGLEWISAVPNGSDGAVLHKWVDQVMCDTGAFFAAPPIREYEFDANAGELRFPSALTTPHPANNTVLARWFPAADAPAVGRSGPCGRAVVVLPQWNSDAEGHIGLSRLLARCGVSALRLSLPYHDSRMQHRTTPDDGSVVGGQKTHRHDLKAVLLCRYDLSSIGRKLRRRQTKHDGDVGTINVSIEDADPAAALGQRERKVHGDGRLANAPLARAHSDDVLDARQRRTSGLRRRYRTNVCRHPHID